MLRYIKKEFNLNLDILVNASVLQTNQGLNVLYASSDNQKVGGSWSQSVSTVLASWWCWINWFVLVQTVLAFEGEPQVCGR